MPQQPFKADSARGGWLLGSLSWLLASLRSSSQAASSSHSETAMEFIQGITQPGAPAFGTQQT